MLKYSIFKELNMYKATINGVVYESKYSMSIINNKIMCDGDYYINGKLQGKDIKEPTGKNITKEFNIEHIKSLDNGYFNIELMIDPSIEKEELSITASEATHKNMLVKFKSSHLAIDIQDNISGEIKVILKAKSLEKITNSGLGEVTGYVNTSKLSIYNEGTSSVKLSGKVYNLLLDNSGVGKLNTIELFATKVSFSNSGIGDIKFTSQVINSGEMSGIGSVKYYADKETKISKSGLGSIKYLGSKNFESNVSEDIVQKTTIKVEPEIILNKSSKDNESMVSLSDIEKSVHNNKTIQPQENKSGLLSALGKKFKKFL